MNLDMKLLLTMDEDEAYRQIEEHILPSFDEARIVRRLREVGVPLSEQAVRVLNGIQTLPEIGQMIFLDRYSLKAKREDIHVGDLVIANVKDDVKYPVRALGIITQLLKDKENRVEVYLITGEYEGERLTTPLFRVDKPLEAFADTAIRVARAVAANEPAGETRLRFYADVLYALVHHHIQPAGRILTGASKGKQGYTMNLTLYNCYVIPSPKDSRSGIIETLRQMVEIFSRGGGVGVNLSTLRPRYAYVRGVHGKSSGAVSWGALYSYATGLIEQGGSRRGALMLMLADWHPDVEEFITSKTQAGMIENANISVLVSDAFMRAVKEDEDWELVFPDYEAVDPAVYEEEWSGDIREWKEKGYPVKVYKRLKARELWDKLIRSAWASAEPGVVFIDRYNYQSNSWYFNRIVATNPCGEQGLPAWGVCNLSHLYLASFAKQVGEDAIGPRYEFDWDALRKTTRVLTRFLDNIIDITPYHFKENEKNQKRERRIGLGTLGLAELLIKLRLRYGSDEANAFIDKIYRTIAEEAYLESVRLAEEKGAFPAFNAEKFLQSGFMQGMPEHIREAVREKGIRNVTLLTQAPTGTVGTMLGTSTGIEPYYSFKYYRKSRLGTFEMDIPIAEQYKKEGRLPDFFVSALDLTPEEHVKVQAAVQRWVDSSISKTANMPREYTIEETKRLYEKAYEWGCKGVTIFRDGSRSDQILTAVKEEKKDVKVSRETAQSTSAYTSPSETTVKEKPLRQRVKREVKGIMQSEYHEIETGYGTLHVNIIYDEQGPLRVFASITPLGSEIAGLTAALAIMISKYLENGGDPERILKHLQGIKGDKPFGVGKTRVDSIPHAIAIALRKHLERTGKLGRGQQSLKILLAGEAPLAERPSQPGRGEGNAHDTSSAVQQAEHSQTTLSPQERVEVEAVGTQKDAASHEESDLYCPQCYSRNVVMVDGCPEPMCLDCGYSKCG